MTDPRTATADDDDQKDEGFLREAPQLEFCLLQKGTLNGRRPPPEEWRDLLNRVRQCINEAKKRGFAVHSVITTIVNGEEFDDMFLESTDMELFRNVRTNKDLDSYDGEVIDVEDCIDSVCMYLGLLDLPGGQRPLEARGVPEPCTEGKDGGCSGVSIIPPERGKQHKIAAKRNKSTTSTLHSTAREASSTTCASLSLIQRESRTRGPSACARPSIRSLTTATSSLINAGLSHAEAYLVMVMYRR